MVGLLSVLVLLAASVVISLGFVCVCKGRHRHEFRSRVCQRLADIKRSGFGGLSASPVLKKERNIGRQWFETGASRLGSGMGAAGGMGLLAPLSHLTAGNSP